MTTPDDPEPTGPTPPQPPPPAGGPPAGWYPNPDNPAESRFWDGRAWTTQVQPAQVQPAAAPTWTPPPAGVPAGNWFARHKLLTIIGGSLALVLVICVVCVAALANRDDDNPPAATGATPAASEAGPQTPAAPTPAAPTSAPAPPAGPTTPAAPAPPTVAMEGEGTFLVPADVKPGTYTAPDAATGCYWARLKGTSGSFDDLVANDNAAGPTVVTILKTDKAFETNGCGDWVAGTPKIVSNTKEINDGTWKVGVNVQPGTYRVSKVDGCYWARLRNFTGDFNAIIANDNVNGRGVVTIASSDKGFTSKNCGTWKR